MKWIHAALIAGYVAAGLLTFGHVFNANYGQPAPAVDCGNEPDILENFKGWSEWWYCKHGDIDAKYSGPTKFIAGLPAAYAGVAWPAYWAGRFAIEVTR